MKLTIIFICFTISVVSVFYCVTEFNRSHKRSEIVSQLTAYKDSIGRSHAQLAHMRAMAILHNEERGYELAWQPRLDIKKKIWGWQWKVDSLEVELKK